MAVQAVGLGQLQPALGRLVLYDHLISLEVVIRNVDVHRKTVVHKMFRDNGFFNLISAIGQHRRFSHTVSIRGYGSDQLSVSCTFMCRNTRQSRNRELSTRQEIAGQLIFLHDADLALDGIVGHSKIGGFVGMHHSRKLDQFSDIPDRILMLADGVAAFGKRGRNSDAVIIRGHGASQCAGSIVDVKLHTADRHTVQAVRLDQTEITLRRLVLHNDLDSLPIILGDRHIRGKVGKHEMVRSLGFGDAVGTVSQQRRFRNSIAVRSDHRHDFSITSTIMCGDTADSGNGKLRASQQIAGQCILLHDADAPLRAFQLLDHFADRKLPSNAAPGTVVGIRTVKLHERNGMAQYPANRMHGGFLVHDA